MFDPFFSRKGNQEDVWLGLSMSYDIIIFFRLGFSSGLTSS
jgi:C4-dicarboxylate-specific signal transduction histidine kinase